MSQLTRIADRFLREDQWLSVPIHLDISYSACQGVRSDNMQTQKCTAPFLTIVHKWLTRQPNTGELPRTGDTLLKAFRKCGIGEDALKEMLEILMME